MHRFIMHISTEGVIDKAKRAIIKSSGEVIAETILDNGAIIAVDMPEYYTSGKVKKITKARYVLDLG